MLYELYEPLREPNLCEAALAQQHSLSLAI